MNLHPSEPPADEHRHRIPVFLQKKTPEQLETALQELVKRDAERPIHPANLVPLPNQVPNQDKTVGKLLFQNEISMLIFKKGLFGLTYHPLFAKVYAVSKTNGAIVLVKGLERSFLMIVLSGLQKKGLSTSRILNSYFLEEYTEAVLSGPGSIVWDACFKYQTPDEVIARESEEAK